MKDLFNSISREVKKIYPSTTQYIQDVPEGFKRPSIFIQFVDLNREDLNKDVYMDVITFKIIYFPLLNSFNIADKLDLMEEAGKIMNFLSVGHIEIEGTDRVGKIDGINANTLEGNVHISFDLTLTDMREFVETRYDLMGKLNVNEDILEED